jgi:hypothetical protein
MKILRLFAFLTIAASVTLIVSCGDDDEGTPTSLVNFAQTGYDADATNLSPVNVTLTLEPASAGASTIEVNFSGGEGSFTTSPALSGNSVTVPVEAGDASVSFTVNFVQDNLPAGDFVVEMTLGDVGPNLNTGITTSASINVANVELTALPYTEDFGADCEGTFPPEGWVIQNPQTNTAGSGGTNTGSWKCNTFAMIDGAGGTANAFVGGSEDPNTSETWIISPILGPITSSSTLSFGGDLRFNDLQEGFEWYDVVISTNYNGLNFESATWTRFDAGYNALAGNDVGRDDITIYDNLSLSAFEGQAVTVAFIYRCSRPANCAAIRVDSFAVN